MGVRDGLFLEEAGDAVDERRSLLDLGMGAGMFDQLEARDRDHSGIGAPDIALKSGANVSGSCQLRRRTSSGDLLKMSRMSGVSRSLILMPTGSTRTSLSSRWLHAAATSAASQPPNEKPIKLTLSPGSASR